MTRRDVNRVFRGYVGVWLGVVAAVMAAGQVGAQSTITFVSASDTHYAFPDEKNDRERAILNSINSLTNRTLGGSAIPYLRGVLSPGDMIDTGLATQWSYWTRDFGLNGGDGEVLKYPVFEDFGGTGHDGATMPDNITARNAQRFGLTATSGYNYSWDWNGVHFVTAGIKAAGSDYTFLANDLETHVGASGRPVVIMEHEDANNLDQALYDNLLKNYNVILMVNGHESGGAVLWNGIQTLSGNGFLSGYWTIQISGNTLKAARTTGGSGNMSATVNRTFTTPASVASITGVTDGSWDRPQLWSGGVTPQSNGDYASLDGSTAATLTLDGARVLSGLNLDARGATGYTINPGAGGSLTLKKTGGSVSISSAGKNRIAAPISMDNDAAVWTDAFGELEISGGISGTDRALAKAGAGTLVLSGNNTYSGPTTVVAGILRVSGANAIPGGIGAAGGTSGITINGGTLELTDTDFERGTGTGAHQVQFAGPGGFRSLGSGGDRAVNLGGAAATVTWGSGSFVPTGSALRLGSATGALRFKNPINLGSADRAIEVSSGTARLDGGVSGTGGLTVSGGGTLVLSRAATYTGTTTISSGTLQLGASDVSGSENNMTLAGAITGAGALVKDGNTTVTLSAAGTHTGGTTVKAGTLRLGHAGALGFGAQVVKGASLTGTTVQDTVDLNGKTLGGRFTLDGGALVNNGGGTAKVEALAGVTTSNGGTGIAAGTTVSLEGGGGSGASASATLGLTTSSFTFSNIGRDYVVGDILYITGGGGSGARVRITGLGASNGIGTWTLIDPGSGYTSAPTTVTGGGAGRNAAITGNAENFQIVSMALNSAGSGYTNAPTVNLSSGSGFVAQAELSSIALTAASRLGGSGRLDVAAPITGDYGITKIGAGAVNLTGASTYTGGTTVEAGTLFVNNATGSATGTGTVTVQTGGTLGGAGTVGGDVVLDAGGKLSPGNSPGVMVVEGDLDISQVENDGSLIFEIGDPTPGNYDQVQVSGILNLGNLTWADFTFSSGGTPLVHGQEYTLFTYGSKTGSLDANPANLRGVVPDDPAGHIAQLSDTGTSIAMRVIPEPSTVCMLLLCAAGGLTLRRRLLRRE